MRCRIFWIFAALYAIALAILIVGTFGLFGQNSDPLSGIFLIPLGFPWSMLADFAPESAKAWLTALAPLVNLGLIHFLCRYLHRR